MSVSASSRTGWYVWVLMSLCGVACHPSKEDVARMSAEIEQISQQQEELAKDSAAERERAHEHGQQVQELTQRHERIERELRARESEKTDGGAADGSIGLGHLGVIGEDSDAPRPRSGRPDPNAVYKVEIGDSHTLGSPQALVTMVMWTDYQCPFSKRLQQTVEELRRLYGDKIRVVHKHNPLPMHHRAMAAALAAEAASKQGKFWEMNEKLWKNSHDLSDEDFERYATELSLDVDLFLRDYADRNQALRHRIEREQETAQKLGARGTPASFINGRFVSGAQSLSVFEALIDEELEKARSLVEQGTDPSRVYEQTIKTGKTGP